MAFLLTSYLSASLANSAFNSGKRSLLMKVPAKVPYWNGDQV